MKRLLSLNSLRKDFMRDEKGLAATEFALMLPFLLTLYLGFVEIGKLDKVHSRVGDTAATINDIVTKLPQIDVAALDAAMLAGSAIAGEMGDNIAVRVVGVSIDAQGTTTVLWSRSRNTSAPAAGSSYPLPASLTNEAGFIVTTETNYMYDYSPSSAVTIPPVEVEYKYFHVPRSSDITDCIGC